MKGHVTIALVIFSLITGLVMLKAEPVAGANKKTDLDKFQGRVDNSAPANTVVNPPVVCVCKGAVDPFTNEVGQLKQLTGTTTAGPETVTFVKVTCAVPFFEPSGAFFFELSCDNWEILPK